MIVVNDSSAENVGNRSAILRKRQQQSFEFEPLPVRTHSRPIVTRLSGYDDAVVKRFKRTQDFLATGP